MRYLTKTRFQLALECETKLFYTGKKEYANEKMEDAFLQALAEGGFQVGELAKCYYPEGIQIKERDYDGALAATDELLKKDNVVIFEAAFRYRNLFIRTDILVKEGNAIELIEVKAKSFDGDDYSEFLDSKKKYLSSKWKPYLYDVAFQRYVLEKSHPNFKVSSFLMLADKTAIATIEGLNQKFLIRRDSNGHPVIQITGDVTPEALGSRILRKVCTDEVVEMIFAGKDGREEREQTFAAYIHSLADAYEQDKKIVTPIGVKCAGCEFNATADEEAAGLRSGFKECWSNALGWKEKHFREPLVLDVWNFRRKDELMAQGKHRMQDIRKNDIITDTDSGNGTGLSIEQRQWLQITKAVAGDKEVHIDKKGLRKEMSSWKFPLHFIDFETSSVAIPFNIGRRPYEGIAFQFSHHQVNEDGTIIHKGQYLNRAKGAFPNFDFIRAFRNELQADNGTIFRYSHHENTYLNLVYRQLMVSDAGDKDELIQFIQSISYSAGKTEQSWTGERNMVDMWAVLKSYYYHPATNGSNSMKAVLPSCECQSSGLYSPAEKGSGIQ